MTRDHKIVATKAAGGVFAMLAGMLALCWLIVLFGYGALAAGSIG